MLMFAYSLCFCVYIRLIFRITCVSEWKRKKATVCQSRTPRQGQHGNLNNLKNQSKQSLKARFHYDRGKDYSLFVLLIFFALLSARFNFKRGKINKKAKNAPSETGLNSSVYALYKVWIGQIKLKFLLLFLDNPWSARIQIIKHCLIRQSQFN